MYREAIKELVKWKSSKRRKPLIIEGARQVGKTWLVREFAHLYYEQLVYINFENNIGLKDLFTKDLQINRIKLEIEGYYHIKITPENTLIFFDEIQEAKNGLTVLKYFCEDAPELNVIAAGSLLGIMLHKHESFPVGKVNFLTLYPLNFIEFLYANGEERIVEFIKEERWDSLAIFSTRLIRLLKQYIYVGGMPEVVKDFVVSHDWQVAREIQNEILNSYKDDFSKHAPKELVARIMQVWNSLPAQLSKENKKFIYGVVREGGRAKDFELAIQWLEDCGLIHKINNVRVPHLPLEAYKEFSIFKIYMNDVGLLGAMSGLPSRTVVLGDEVFKEFKGALTEQYVFQQLIQKNKLYYYSKPNSQQEIDFLIQKEDNIIPVEVKAGINLQAKSLRQFVKENDTKTAYRLSLADYRKEERVTNIPLYCVTVLDNEDEA